jgi:excisionase family DNA binding protein
MTMRLADELEKRKNALTVRELALLLSLSEKLLYRLIRQGALPALRVGTSVRLDPTVTANWIRGRVTAR